MSRRDTPIKNNFTSGELKKTLHAREDLGFYNNGAKKIENMIVLPEGGLTRRPGTRFVLPVPDETQPALLMPFKFSRQDSRIVCFNRDLGLVLKSGGPVEVTPGWPYTFSTPFAAADLPNLRWAEAADLVFVATGGEPLVIKRRADTNWTVEPYPYSNGPVRTQNTDTARTIGVSGISGSITLTANFDIFQQGHVGTVFRLDESDLSLIPYWTASEDVQTNSVPESSNRRYLGNVYVALAPPGQPPGVYKAGVNPPVQTFGDFQSEPGAVRWRFRYAGYGYVRITSVIDARRALGDVIGVQNTPQTDLPDSIVAKPTYRWHEPAWSSIRGFPTAVTFVQQRVAWFDRIGQFWLTEPGDYYSFRTTEDAASAVVGQMLSIDGSVVQPVWAISNGWIVVGAKDGEPVIRGPSAYDAITKDNVTVITDKGQGSASQVPAIVDAGVAFIGVSRERVHYAKTNRLIESINVDELSVASNHVLRGKAAGLAYQHDPHRLLWGYSQNGDLWCYTFRPDQQVVAATRHPMAGGFVESMAAMYSADGARGEIWMVVRRVINGQTRRFIEVLEPFFEPLDPDAPTTQNAWFFDCAVEYVGAPTTTIFATHLAGATVGVMVGGQDIGDRVVAANGAISIPLIEAAQIRVVAGLRMPFKVETLDMSPAANGRTTRGAMKRATHGVADLADSYGLDVAVDAGEGALDRETLFQTAGEPTLGAPLPLFTGRKHFPLTGAHGASVRVVAEGDHAYPVTLLGLAPDIELSEL